MLHRCEHFPHTNHTRPSTTDTNNTVIESHAGQRWRSEPAGRSGLDTAPSLQSVDTESVASRHAPSGGARAAPADLEERRACQGAPAPVKRASRVALVRVRRRYIPLASRVFPPPARVASSFLRPGKVIRISPSRGGTLCSNYPQSRTPRRCSTAANVGSCFRRARAVARPTRGLPCARNTFCS
jgi:hypothetical protein